MHRTPILALALLAAGPLAAAPLPGCYQRVYDGAHLAAHPDQVVAEMRLEVIIADGSEGMNAVPGSTVAFLEVLLAHQGHVTRESAPQDGFPNGFGGAVMYTALKCGTGGRLTCGVDCMGEVQDEGFDVVAQDGDGLTIRTDALEVGQGQACGGYTDIAEGRATTFVLTRVDDAVCAPD